MRLSYQFQLIQAIRNFFTKEGFTDVMTPPLVDNPGMETHIHPFKVKSVYGRSSSNHDYYLHTSPEFCMKELLASHEEDLDKIFTISYAFRDEPMSTQHRKQFLMLEWYRKNEYYSKIMSDVERLIQSCFGTLESYGAPMKKSLKDFKVQRVTIQEAFYEYCGFDILNFAKSCQIPRDTTSNYELDTLIRKDFKDVPMPDEKCNFEDSFFLLFLNKIEPKLSEIPFILLYEYPAQLAALSTLSSKDPRVCERFEVYLFGVEICNCFNELTDIDEQKRRFAQQNAEKQNLYNYQLPEPHTLYNALQKGLPSSSGVALGVERLLMSITHLENPFYK